MCLMSLFQKKCFLVMVIILMLMPAFASAEDLEPSAPPADPNSAMYRLEDIYNRLNTGASGTKRSGAFEEPAEGPGVVGHTLNEIMGKAPAVDDVNGATAADVKKGKTFWGLKSGQWGSQTGTADISSGPCDEPALVPKTGQTTSYEAGDDGELERGIAWPDPRFTDNGDGTVTDNLTGLFWLKNANCAGDKTWADALSFCNSLQDGQCGLTDGSRPGDWRLPNLRELQSLIDYGRYTPALPSGHPFVSVRLNYYWSSTTYANATDAAWYVYLRYGNVNYTSKGYYLYVWPVRGGH